jgi:hypothetical protein
MIYACENAHHTLFKNEFGEFYSYNDVRIIIYNLEQRIIYEGKKL